MRPDRDHEKGTGKDELLHGQFRREEAGREILISTGGNQEFHRRDSGIPQEEFTL